jgi:hypothetical protein
LPWPRLERLQWKSSESCATVLIATSAATWTVPLTATGACLRKRPGMPTRSI